MTGIGDTARRAVRDFRKYMRQLEALRLELGPPAGRGWVSRGYGGQYEEFFEPRFPHLSWSMDLNDLPGLRNSQRIIRRDDILLKRASTLNREATASLERLQRVMRRGETVRDVLRGRRAGTR